MIEKRSILLACSLIVSANVSLAAGKCSTTTGNPDRPNSFPTPPGAIYDHDKSHIDILLHYNVDIDGIELPVKTLKITNNNPDMVIFPIMRDGNEAVVDPLAAKLVGKYDPSDAAYQEYRGYIGYKATDGKTYFGLQPCQSILVQVPLVFWNGARMNIVIDGNVLTPRDNAANPTGYNPNAHKIIVDTNQYPNDNTLIKNGVVMWYHDDPVDTRTNIDFSPDSPAQLLEWTIRDKPYYSNPKYVARVKLDPNDIVTLINYDVSYVDNMVLPAAMEAINVPVPPDYVLPTKAPFSYGYVGTPKKLTDLQQTIRDFTQDKNQILTSYFNGKGWPMYFLGNNPPDNYIKIPSGQRLFADSPRGDHRSKYVQNKYMLTSAATGDITVNIGDSNTPPPDEYTLMLTNDDNTSPLIKKVAKGDFVVGYCSPLQVSPIRDDQTTVSSITIPKKLGEPARVVLNKRLTGPQSNCNFDFNRPISDYASDAIAKLWYSWANHYVELTKDTPTVPDAVGSVMKNGMRLTFEHEVNGLVEGMTVTGPGLDNEQPADLKVGVTILAIAEDHKSVILSQVANETFNQRNYSFVNPKKLPTADFVNGLYTLNFNNDNPEEGRDHAVFAKKVYQIMAALSQIQHDNGNMTTVTRIRPTTN